VAEQALAQIPTERVAELEILLHINSAGATRELLDWGREAQFRFLVGYGSARPNEARKPRCSTDAGAKREPIARLRTLASRPMQERELRPPTRSHPRAKQ
jgi:hypothetical protein